MQVEGVEEISRPPARRSRVPKPLRNGILIFLVLLVLEYLVVPELVGASKDLHLLDHVSPVWLVVGVLLEGGALLSYALMTKTILPSAPPPLFRLFRIVLSTTAISHVIPAGTAGGTGLGYKLLTDSGVKGSDAGFTLGTEALGSAVVLNVLLWFSLLVSIPLAGFHPIYVVVALGGLLALAAAGALAYAFTRGEQRAVRVVGAIGRRIPRVGADRLAGVIRSVGHSLSSLASDRQVMRRALTWTAMNWLLDAASLWCFLAALGRYVDPFELFAAYGIANVLAVIPVTPGGLGIIDASAPALLVSFGVTRNVATLGVLGWRLVNFWLPIPLGAAAYVSLKVPRGSGLRARRQALSAMAAESKPTADEPDLLAAAPDQT
jgi:uncharacterized protein (TIRG00374 family)